MEKKRRFIAGTTKKGPYLKKRKNEVVSKKKKINMEKNINYFVVKSKIGFILSIFNL